MRIILLGGAGFIGSNLALALKKLGYDVNIFDQSNEVKQKMFLEKGIRFYEGNYITGENIEKVIQKNDIVLHLVSTSVPKMSNTDLMTDARNNILPSINLIKICAEKGVKKIIFSSSGGTIYGVPEYLPINEKHKTDPTSAYGVHKLSIEKYMQLANELYGLPVNIMRISNPYGPGQVPFRGQGVIPTFIASMILNKKIQIWGDGNSVRDYIYIDDLVNAIIALIQSNVDMDIFNIGSGVGVNVKSILDTIEKRLGIKANIEYIDDFISDVKSNILDCSKIYHTLNWRTNITLDEGIDKMINAWDGETGEFSLFRKA
jgi:UDP-glucose 4-epimerase